MSLSDELAARARILVIDGERANVRLLERLLLTGGLADVRGCTDPAEAVALFEDMRPDIVLVDAQMQAADGVSLIDALRARCVKDDDVPMLALTAAASDDAAPRSLAGAVDFVSKPFERTEVLVRTRNLLETRFLRLAIRQERSDPDAALTHRAFHDSLTGLANRALFRDRVGHALERCARGHHLAILLLDLDDFTVVNDIAGRAVGDRAIRAVADRLARATRGYDTVARTGGDEFAVLLDGVEHDDAAMAVIDRITHALSVPVILDGTEYLVSSSIGVAYATGGERVDELLRNADVAMHIAKDDGKSRHAVFDPHMYAELLERLGVEADLRQALDRGELRVMYQPIVELETGAITGVEALLRWQHREFGGATAAFIPIAEESGLIVPIGRWVLAEACRQGREWMRAAGDRAPTVSVNVSARQLQDPRFVRDVAEILADTQFPPWLLVLEIDERIVVSHAPLVRERLAALKELGMRFAIDDFGTGHSSLSYLQTFPFDVLKIDRSLITGLAQDSGDATLASTIVEIATTLRLHAVAEGIERPEQRTQLLSLGCTHGQGFLFAAAVGPGELTAMMRAGSTMVEALL